MTEHRLQCTFDPEHATGKPCPDQAPRLEAAAERIGGEREPLDTRDAKRGKQSMKAFALARREECGDRLIGIVGISTRIRIAIHQRINPGANRLMMQETVEQSAPIRDGRLDHEHAAAWTEHALRAAEECVGNFEVMQHVDHDDVRGAGVGERKPLSIRHAIEPWRRLDVCRDHVAKSLLQVADTASDLDGEARPASRSNAIIDVVVDDTQDRFVAPHVAVVFERIGRRQPHYIALMRMNANSTMRSNMKPWRKREIWVSP